MKEKTIEVPTVDIDPADEDEVGDELERDE
jgi:hypothetical protein